MKKRCQTALGILLALLLTLPVPAMASGGDILPLMPEEAVVFQNHNGTAPGWPRPSPRGWTCR